MTLASISRDLKKQIAQDWLRYLTSQSQDDALHTGRFVSTALSRRKGWRMPMRLARANEISD